MCPHRAPSLHALCALLAALVLLLPIACSDESGPATSGDTDADVSPGDASDVVDEGADADADESDTPDAPPDDVLDASDTEDTEDAERLPDPPLTAPATTARLTNDFRLGVDAMGSGSIGRVEMTRNVGTIEIDGQTYAGFAHERQPWQDFELTLYQAIFAGSDRLYVAWFYCEAGSLTWIYYEGTDGSRLRPVPMTGTCDEVRTMTTSDVAIPDMEIAEPTLIGGYRVEGAEIAITSRLPGRAVLRGRPFDVYVFDDVDCSLDCGEQSWFELHALVRGQEPDATLGFAIFYLRYAFERPSEVQVFYGLTLPGFERIPGRTFEATWSLAP